MDMAEEVLDSIMKVKVLVGQSCPILCDPMDCSLQASSVEFSRQEYWSRLPFPSPEDLPNPGIYLPQVSFIAGRFFTIWTTKEAPHGSYPIPMSPHFRAPCLCSSRHLSQSVMILFICSLINHVFVTWIWFVLITSGYVWILVSRTMA